MTNVYITNRFNTVATGIAGPYHVLIECTNIDRDYVNNIKVTLNRPKERSSQDSESVTQFIDLQQKTKSVTITGTIDRYSFSSDTLIPIAQHDAGVVKQMLEYMFDRGGVNDMVIGEGDGFYTMTNIAGYTERVTGIMTRMSIKEDFSDRVSKTQTSNDYPSSIPITGISPNYNKSDQLKIPNKYQVTITMLEGVLP